MSDYRPPTYEEMTEMLMNPIEDVESSFKPEPIRDWTDEEKNPPSRKTDHENSTTNYVEKYRKNNEAMIKQNSQFVKKMAPQKPKDNHDLLSLSFSDFDGISTVPTTTVADAPIPISKHNRLLPIYKHRHEILEAIHNHQITIIVGDTGCGKTTQVPQYILDSCTEKKDPYINIIVSQPRKIAAITLADRVAKERRCELGSEVGYQVGLKKVVSEIENETKILYCTTGVVLNKLANDKSLMKYSHIILDEVHERDLNTDLLLAFIRRLMVESLDTKLILMSATINKEEFEDYFTISDVIKPAIVQCNQRRIHSIGINFLDDFKLTRTEKDIISYGGSPKISAKMLVFTQAILFNTLRSIKLKMEDGSLSRASILIFLPGLMEIGQIHETITHYHPMWIRKLKLQQQHMKAFEDIPIVVLHSSLSTQDQRKAFEDPAPIKMILSTNIAESSVTIPNVTHVVDFCMTKYLLKMPGTNITTLVTDWASVQNLEQRAGRCGRVSDGTVIRMVHRWFFEKEMLKFATPEIKQAGLESAVLKIKTLDMAPPLEICALTMNPPKKSLIVDAVLLLKEIGALLKVDKVGKFSYDDGELTYLGRLMDGLPVDCHVAKLIVLGYIFNLVDEALVIGAGLSLKSIFYCPFGKKLEAYSSKFSFAAGTESDCFAILNAYNEWHNIRNSNNQFKSTFCRVHNLDQRNLQEMDVLIQELRVRLEKLGLKEICAAKWSHSERDLMVKVLIAGAFGPHNFFTLVNTTTDVEAFRTVNHHDIFRTIYFKGMKQDDFSRIYSSAIKDLLVSKKIINNDDQVLIHFQDEKVLIQFKDVNETKRNACFGKIPKQIYRALKLRSDKYSIKVGSIEEEMMFAKLHGYGAMKDGEFVFHDTNVIKHPERCFLPTKTVTKMSGQVTHVQNNGNFFFQPSSAFHQFSDESMSMKDYDYKTFKKELQDMIDLTPVKAIGNVKMDDKVIVKHEGTKLRGKVHCLDPLTIHLIDRGNCIEVEQSAIRKIADADRETDVFDYPPQVFECSLLEVQPGTSSLSNGIWPYEAIELLRKLVKCDATISIFAVFEDVVTVDLFSPDDVCWNEKLIELGYAQETEESHVNKYDHDLRLRALKNFEVIWPKDEFKDKIVEIPMKRSPESGACSKELVLKGPNSPLETYLRGISIGTKNGHSNVSHTSVNCVLLDDSILSKKKKVFVGTNISTKNDNLTVQETSLIPQIDGLAVIIAMVFSPTVQIRRDIDKKKYVSILCGLGYDKVRKESYYPSHDTAMDIDFNMSPKDIIEVNKIRALMSQIMKTKPGETGPSLNDGQKCELMEKIQEIAKVLFINSKDRFQVTNELPSDAFEWNVDQVDATKFTSPFGIYAIFDTVDIPKINFTKDEMMMEMNHHRMNLIRAADGNIMLKENICRFCNFIWESKEVMILHLSTKRHETKVKKYFGNC